jgi:hypothetical protein
MPISITARMTTRTISHVRRLGGCGGGPYGPGCSYGPGRAVPAWRTVWSSVVQRAVAQLGSALDWGQIAAMSARAPSVFLS